MARKSGTDITVNDLHLKASVMAIKTKKNRLGTSTASIPKVKTCKGIAVSDYEKEIREIAKLLNRYKDLLDKDLNDADTSREYFALIDKEISNTLKKIR